MVTRALGREESINELKKVLRRLAEEPKHGHTVSVVVDTTQDNNFIFIKGFFCLYNEPSNNGKKD